MFCPRNSICSLVFLNPSLSFLSLSPVSYTHLVQEYRGTDIRISSISPGPVSTTIWSHKTTPPDKALMMKMLRPQDIADIAAFLLALPDHVHIRDLEVTPWKMA